MKSLLGKIQKDFALLQKTLEKEGNDLLGKAKKAVNDIAKNNDVQARTKQLEKLIETKFKKFTPALNKFIVQVQKNASKYGLEIKDIENMLKTGVKKAKTSWTELSGGKTKTTAKKPAPKKAATSKKKVKTKPSTQGRSSAAQSSSNGATSTDMGAV